ncbi:NEP1-interacting protein-like 1 [Gracilariopsis chorda]|uniref:NEP1-interacting protein-like 1 n=1 Tax=Gracilariopsis chorda TaxID=448386 RepID=A0A2V3IWA0_9FLOR|nr:NEP1-interacting protein-like 1 [Gracilariopsis chorda]|eukprot:PXF46418.1 NEP1-interacting protein-like 1 [Gracilariopsis chorda]
MPTWCVAFLALWGVIILLVLVITARAVRRHLSFGLYPSHSNGHELISEPPLRASSTTTSSAHSERDRASAGALSDAQIANAAPKTRNVDAESMCSICLDSIDVGQSVRTIVQCGHSFHSACVKTWLRRANKCPNCQRTALVHAEKARLDVDSKSLRRYNSITDRLHPSGSFGRFFSDRNT